MSSMIVTRFVIKDRLVTVVEVPAVDIVYESILIVVDTIVGDLTWVYPDICCKSG